MDYFYEFAVALCNGVLLGGVYSLIAVGLSLCYGVMGILNFAHGSIVMLGMYATYFSVTSLGFNPYLSAIVVAPLFFLIGILFHAALFRFALKAAHNNQILITIGLYIFLNNLAQQLFSPNVRLLSDPFLEETFSIFGVVFTYPRTIGLFLSIIIFVSIIFFLKTTYLGKGIIATSQSVEGAKVCGVNESNIYYFVVGIATMIAGVAGLITLPFSAVYPEIGDNFILIAFVIVVLGGMGSISGTFWAAIIIGISETVGATFLGSSAKTLIPFIVFIITLFFKPEGIFKK